MLTTMTATVQACDAEFSSVAVMCVILQGVKWAVFVQSMNERMKVSQ